jgi:crotonobetainyl-CoA:carnitine CoA-transferase CaiB-like acyl-CoA transferase
MNDGAAAQVRAAETFSGLRVLELTTTIAGPYCGVILADQGAEVVKVERPGRGDDAREMPPHRGTDSAVFEAVNRNKRGVVLDLKSSKGRAAFLRLADRSDVVVQNSRPGVVDELGIGPEAVLARNPGAVYCSISAFGDAGSAAGLPGYDPLIQAFTGMMSMTGEPGREPVRAAASVIDLATGMWAAMAIMAALVRRLSTRRGEHIEVTMVDTGFALLCHQILGMRATGEVPGPLGSASPITAPYESFHARDGWVMIAAGNDSLFGRLCTALGLTELVKDPRFARASVRVRHRHALHELIQSSISGSSRSEVLDLLQAAGVPVGPVHSLDEALAHPVAVERGVMVEGPGGSPLPQVRLPIIPPGTTPSRRPPLLGEHTAEVLREVGLSAREIAELT